MTTFVNHEGVRRCAWSLPIENPCLNASRSDTASAQCMRLVDSHDAVLDARICRGTEWSCKKAQSQTAWGNQARAVGRLSAGWRQSGLTNRDYRSYWLHLVAPRTILAALELLASAVSPVRGAHHHRNTALRADRGAVCVCRIFFNSRGLHETVRQ
jgi:hypothetical protein